MHDAIAKHTSKDISAESQGVSNASQGASRHQRMCFKRVSRRLKDLQVRRRAHRNPCRTASNSESSKPLAHIGVGVVCKFAHADALRFHFLFFSRTVPFSPRRNVGKWISYFSEPVFLSTHCMTVHLKCVCMCMCVPLYNIYVCVLGR